MRPLTEEETKSVFESMSTELSGRGQGEMGLTSRTRKLHWEELGPSYR
jgi:hypothetical protein